MFLLHKCAEFAQKTSVKFIVAHVNHGLRGKESDLDAQFVKKTAEKLNLIYEETTLKKLPKGNLEEQCRIKRYEFLEKIRNKYKANWILTAHHQNDNIETVLLNLTRGSFLNGLSGIKEIDTQRKLLRPLLNLTKEEILHENKRLKIKYRDDKSNFNIIFSRNLIRIKIIPELKKINPGLEKTLAKNITLTAELNDFLNQSSEKWLKKNYSNTKIPRKSFLNLHPAVQKNILLLIYIQLNGNPEKFNQKHLEQILKIISQNHSNKKKEFGSGHFISIEKKGGEQKICFTKR